MYKACIFDLDGTLTDTLDSLSVSVNGTLKEMGLSQITDEQVKAFVGHGVRRLLEQSLEVSGDEKFERIEEAMEIYARIFKDKCTYHVAPYDGIMDMLQEFQDQGVKMAVLSNKPHLATIEIVEEFFGKDTFQDVQGQKEGVPRKPDPTALNLIIEGLQVSKEDCLYIGDSEADMMVGKAAGIDTAGVTWGFRTRELLARHDATYIVDKAEEIISLVKGDN